MRRSAFFVASFLALLALLSMASAASAVSAIRYVANDGDDTGNCSVDACETIAYAIGQAGAGNTIQVAAGTYAGATLDKSLTLRGAQWGVDARGRSASETVIQSLDDGNDAALNVAANDVTIDGVKIVGSGPADADRRGVNLTSGADRANVTVQNSIFLNLYTGIVRPDFSVTGLTVTQNVFTNDLGNTLAQDAGVWLAGGGPTRSTTNAVINYNDFSNMENDPNGDFAAINFNVGSNLDIIGNTSDHDGSFAVILLTSDVEIKSNTTDNEAGTTILVEGVDGLLVEDNTLQNGLRGLRTTSAFGTGETSSNVQVLHNTITGQTTSDLGTGAGVSIGPGSVEDTETIQVHRNRLVGNSFGVANNSNAAVDATNNWWGCSDGPDQAGCDPTTNTGTGSIDGNPWLTLTASASPASIPTDSTSTITATLTKNSNAETVANAVPDGTSVAFSTDLGSVSPPTDGTSAGDAATVLSAGTLAGTAHVHSVLDNEDVTTNVPVTVGSAHTRYVDDTGGNDAANDCSVMGSPCLTVQHAINVSNPGDTVQVAAGTYAETIDVNKSITLWGAKHGVNPNDGSWNDTRTNMAAESVIHGPINLSLLNTITVDGLTIERTETNEGHILIGAGQPAGSGTASVFDIENNRFVGTRSTGTAWGGIHTNFLDDNGAPGVQFTANQNRIAIAGDASGSGMLINANRPGSDNLGGTAITDNYVADSPGNGLNVNRPGGYLTITGNHLVRDDIFTFKVHNGLINDNTVLDSPQGSIQVVASSAEDSSDVTVSNNTITNNVSLLTNNFSQIDIRGPLTGTNLVTGNSVTLSGTASGPVTGVYGVRIRGTSATGVGNVTVSANTLNGGNIGGTGNATFPPTSGVYVDTDLLTASLDVHIQNNFINGWVNGMSVFDPAPGSFGGLPAGATVQLYDNDMSGNSGLGVASGAGETVNASSNWWGTSTAATVAALQSGPVDYTPWLDSNTDVGGNPANGFQGDFSYLHVDDDSPQVGATTRIQEGVDALTVGGTVNVKAGTYAEHVSIAKRLTLQGAGVTTIVDPATDGPAIAISASGTTPNPLTIKNLKVTGTTGIGNTGSGIAILSGSHIKFDTVESSGNGGHGLAIDATTAVDDLTLDTVDFNGNGTGDVGAGFRIPTSMPSMDGLTILDSHFDNNTFSGMEINGPPATGAVTNVSVTDSTFSGDANKGIYAERLDNATFDGITVNLSGTSGSFAAGIDLNLKKQAFTDITIQDSTITNSGTGDPTNGVGITVKARDDGSNGPTSLTSVIITGNTITGNQTGIRIGEVAKENAGPTDVHIHRNNISGSVSDVGLFNATPANGHAECNWWGDAGGPATAGGDNVVGEVTPGPTPPASTDPAWDFTPWLTSATLTSPCDTLTLSPTTGAFPDQLVGTNSSPMTFTVTNIDDADIVLGSVSFVTGDTTQFNRDSNTCSNQTLSANETCTIDVSFRPTTIGAKATTLRVPSDADGSPDTAALSGNGVQPGASLAPSIWDFGTVAVGASSADKSFTVTNNGTAPLHITTVAVSTAQFVKGTDGCHDTTVGVNGSCVVHVTFQPTSAGHKTANLSVTSDAPGSPTQSALAGDATNFGSITVVLDAVPNNAQDFAFSGDLGAFTLDNDSNATLSNTRTVSNLTAGDYDITQAAVAKWALVTLSCNNSATVDLSNRTVTVHLAAGQSTTCSFTDASRQPDALIATSSNGTYAGNNVYSSTPVTGQTKNLAIARNATKSLWFKVQNESQRTDSFTLDASLTGSTKFNVKFFKGGTDITAQVVAGTYSINNLAAGAEVKFEMRIKAASSTPSNATRNINVLVTSKSAPASQDLVKGHITRS